MKKLYLILLLIGFSISSCSNDSKQPEVNRAMTVSAAPGNGENTINWTAIAGSTSYNIYWANVSGVTVNNGTKINCTGTSYTHTGLTNDNNYYYIVTSIKSDGESAPSSEVAAMPAFAGSSGVKLGMQEAYFSLQSGGDSWNFPNLDAAKRMFDYMDDLKIKRFRYTIFWVAAEPDKGVYAWERHDALINYLVSKGIKLTVTLFGDNYRYVSDGSSPYPSHSDPAYWTGWLNFAEAAVNQYKDRVTTWEIWNEPDLLNEGTGGGMFWLPTVSAAGFSSMLIATSAKIKTIQPESSVVLGGLTTINGYRAYMKGCFDAGVLNEIDEVGVHLYRMKPEGPFNLVQDTTVDIDPVTPGIQLPSTLQEELTSMTAFIDSYKPGFPIRNTEEGFYTNNAVNGQQPISQMKYLTRTVLHQRRYGIEEITLFRLRAVKRTDYAAGASADSVYNNDMNFPGIIDQIDLTTFTPRPAYYALKTMAQYLSDPESKYKTGSTIDVSGLKVHVEIYIKNSKPVIAYWIEEDITNTKKAVRNIAITINGIGDYVYKVVDTADSALLSTGTYNASGNSITFSNLPATDYPFILYAE